MHFTKPEYNKQAMYADYVRLVTELVGNKRREQVLKLLDFLYTKSDFFSAPASSKKAFHM